MKENQIGDSFPNRHLRHNPEPAVADVERCSRAFLQSSDEVPLQTEAVHPQHVGIVNGDLLISPITYSHACDLGADRRHTWADLNRDGTRVRHCARCASVRLGVCHEIAKHRLWHRRAEAFAQHRFVWGD